MTARKRKLTGTEAPASPTLTGAPAPAVSAAVAAPKKKQTLPETTEGLPWPSNHEIKKESNPFTDRDWRMLAYAWTGLLVRIVIIFGAIFTVVQFLANREQASVQRSFELVELWERSEYQAAQKALTDRLVGLNEIFGKDFPKNPTPAETEFYFRKLGDAALTANGGTMPLAEFQEHFDRIVYFLNRVAFCVTEDICSPKVADAYFKDFAVSFWQYFSGHVERQRKGGATSYAQAIEAYVKRGGAAADGAR